MSKMASFSKVFIQLTAPIPPTDYFIPSSLCQRHHREAHSVGAAGFVEIRWRSEVGEAHCRGKDEPKACFHALPQPA